MSLWTDILDAVEDVVDKRPQYGNGTDDITFDADVMLSENVYGRIVTVSQGILVTTAPGSKVTIYARERLNNHGTIRAGYATTPAAGGTAFGGGIDADSGVTSTPGSGGSAGAGAYLGGQGQAPFTNADFPYRTEHQFFGFLDDPDNVPEGVGGGSGAGFGRTSGGGGYGGGCLGVVAPIVDNTDGVISVAGGPGLAGSGADFTGIWAAVTAYGVDSIVQPTTPNGHYYARESGAGNSDSVEPTWPTDGSTVVDDDITWRDLGAGSVVAASAAGGGGGQGGVFGWFGRTWIGNQPDIAGGAGGLPYNGDNATPGAQGQDGYFLRLIDA